MYQMFLVVYAISRRRNERLSKAFSSRKCGLKGGYSCNRLTSSFFLDCSGCNVHTLAPHTTVEQTTQRLVQLRAKHNLCTFSDLIFSIFPPLGSHSASKLTERKKTKNLWNWSLRKKKTGESFMIIECCIISPSGKSELLYPLWRTEK